MARVFFSLAARPRQATIRCAAVPGGMCTHAAHMGRTVRMRPTECGGVWRNCVRRAVGNTVPSSIPGTDTERLQHWAVGKSSAAVALAGAFG